MRWVTHENSFGSEFLSFSDSSLKKNYPDTDIAFNWEKYDEDFFIGLNGESLNCCAYSRNELNFNDKNKAYHLSFFFNGETIVGISDTGLKHDNFNLLYEDYPPIIGIDKSLNIFDRQKRLKYDYGHEIVGNTQLVQLEFSNDMLTVGVDGEIIIEHPLDLLCDSYNWCVNFCFNNTNALFPNTFINSNFYYFYDYKCNLCNSYRRRCTRFNNEERIKELAYKKKLIEELSQQSDLIGFRNKLKNINRKIIEKTLTYKNSLKTLSHSDLIKIFPEIEIITFNNVNPKGMNKLIEDSTKKYGYNIFEDEEETNYLYPYTLKFMEGEGSPGNIPKDKPSLTLLRYDTKLKSNFILKKFNNIFSDNVSLKETITKLNTKIKELEDSIKENENYKTKYYKLQEEFNDFKSNNIFSEENKSLKEKNDNYQKEIYDLKTENNKLKKFIHQNEIELKKYKEKEERFKLFNKTKIELKKSNKTIKDLESKLISLNKDIVDLKGDLDKEKNEKKHEEKCKQEYSQKNSKLSSELKGLRELKVLIPEYEIIIEELKYNLNKINDHQLILEKRNNPKSNRLIKIMIDGILYDEKHPKWNDYNGNILKLFHTSLHNPRKINTLITKCGWTEERHSKHIIFTRTLKNSKKQTLIKPSTPAEWESTWVNVKNMEIERIEIDLS